MNSIAPRVKDVASEYERFSPRAILWRRLRASGLAAVWRLLLVLNHYAKRVFDVTVSLAILFTLSPLLVLFAIVQIAWGRSLFDTQTRLGRWGVPFRRLDFNTAGTFGRVLKVLRLHALARLINVVRGDMSLIGPQPVCPADLDLRRRVAQKRSSVRPGIVSLWWLRKRANIGFTSELEVDLEYIDAHSVRGDMGIALRSLPALLYGSGTGSTPDKVEILGIPISNITMEEALDYLLDSAQGAQPRQVCFVNTDCVNKAQSDAKYDRLLKSVDTVLADGIGVRIAGKLLRQEIRQNVNGTDLFPMLCSRLQEGQLGMYLLGARPGVVDAVRDWVRANYPAAKVVGRHHGFFSQEELPSIREDIRRSGAKILLVAFGSPRQDLWIHENLAQIGVPIAMGVGGLFDFYSGNIPRAPQWMRELSLEWAFRLLKEPGRMWKRYLLGNIVFLLRVVWWMIRRKSAPPLLDK